MPEHDTTAVGAERALARLALGMLPLTMLAALAPAPVRGQVPSGHELVLTSPASGSALLDVDTGTGTFRTLPSFPLASSPALACTWDPIARHAVVAVASAAGSTVARVDPFGGHQRTLATLPDPVLGLALDPRADLLALTSGTNGAIWHLPRNGGPPALRLPVPWATAWDAPARSAYAWVVQEQPSATPTLALLDVEAATVLSGPTPIQGLGGARVTGVRDLPTGAVRQVLTDDAGRIHLFEFLTTLRTLAPTPPLPPGATTALRIEPTPSGIDAIVLGDGRSPFVRRVPVFGPGSAVQTLAGPLPGTPVAFAPVESAGSPCFGTACGATLGTITLQVPPGGSGFLDLASGPPGVAALALFGASEQSFRGLSLPLALPQGSCPLLVAPDVSLATLLDSGGAGRVSFGVPGSLPRGLALYAQWLVLPATGLATSAACAALTEP